MDLNSIIVADDHHLIIIGLTQLLAGICPDATVKCVQDGPSLLNEIRLRQYDLVISDIDMPGSSGI